MAAHTLRRDAPPERDISRDPLSTQPSAAAQPTPNKGDVTQATTPEQRQETTRKVLHPDTRESITLQAGESQHDSVEEVEVEGFVLELNRFGKVQMSALVRIDNIYQPGDKFALEPEQAARLLKQRTDQGFPVVELIPGIPEPPPPPIVRRRPSIARDGLPRGAPDRSFAERQVFQGSGAIAASNVAPSDVFTSGVQAMRLALQSADRALPSDASPADVTAAFNSLFSQVVQGVSPTTPNAVSNTSTGSAGAPPAVGPGANPAGEAAVSTGAVTEKTDGDDDGKGEDTKGSARRSRSGA